MTLLSNIREALQKRAAYVQTRNEIREMPLREALDLGINRGDAEQIAHEAIYG